MVIGARIPLHSNLHVINFETILPIENSFSSHREREKTYRKIVDIMLRNVHRSSRSFNETQCRPDSRRETKKKTIANNSAKLIISQR